MSLLQEAKDTARRPMLSLAENPMTSNTHNFKHSFSHQSNRTHDETPSTSSAATRNGHEVHGKDGESASLGQLLVDMTVQVQEERAKRTEVEQRNHALMLELEQIQKEILELKTSSVAELRRRGSTSELLVSPTRSGSESTLSTPLPRDEPADYWWNELQETKKVKEKALVDAHQRALQVMELNACISMQHDELKALRTSESDARHAMMQAEDRCKDMIQQSTILQQENQLLKDDVAHLNGEIGKRGVHFKALMEKWTEAQAQSEHYERENHAMLEKMKEIRQRYDLLAAELESVKDERDCLQHQVNHLKGAVAAKAAESKAFQAYGTNARDHMQTQNAVIQRHQIYRRKVNKLARDSVVVLKNIKSTLSSIRAPVVSIQMDFNKFLKKLKSPVFKLVAQSRRFVDIAHAEHLPLREALRTAELTRRHLHEQLWRSRRNALMICQIRNTKEIRDSCRSDNDDDTNHNDGINSDRLQALRANYCTGELLWKESDRETLTVKLDAIYSDRAREWNNYESIAPLLQSCLDGYNACVVTFDGLASLRTSSECLVHEIPEQLPQSDTQTVAALILHELFDAVNVYGAHFYRVKLTISYLAIYNECVYDLLGLDSLGQHGHDDLGTSATSMSKIVVLEVQNSEEALLVLRGGQENLETAHQRGIMDTALTHKIITVCVTYDNLLTGVATTKSKLQIVELAMGPQDANSHQLDWADRQTVKSLVTMEHGVNALLTALAEVRVKDSAFVRYHSSKVTTLLQDTIKANAKFLAIVSLASSGMEYAAIMRLLQQFRNAVCLPSGESSVGGSGQQLIAHHDRSVEGFMNRFAQQTQVIDGSNSLVLPFSCTDMQDCARQRLNGRVETIRWEKELDNMNKRYGNDTAILTSSYLLDPKESSPRMMERVQEMNFAQPPTSSSSLYAVKDSEINGQQQPEGFMSEEDPSHFSTLSDNSPPAPTNTTTQKNRKSNKNSKLAKANGGRAMSRPRGLSDKEKKANSNNVSTITRRSHSSTVPVLTRAATLPSSSSAAAATGVLKIRRETASSALKKSRLANILASSNSPFTKKKRIPFR